MSVIPIKPIFDKTFPAAPSRSARLAALVLDSQQFDLDQIWEAGREAPCPILDTPTLQVAQSVSSETLKSSDGRELSRSRAGLSKRNLRLYGRTLAGLQAPGRYYWFSLTSSPQSPPIAKSVRALFYWLRRQCPGIEWIYCITSEGLGVIHMIFRLPMRSKNLDVKKVRKYWTKAHNAKQIRLERVKNPYDLASYFSDQRKKVKMGQEMLHQPGLQRWHRSKNWLPVGISRALRRVNYRLHGFPAKVREITLNNWLKRCFKDPVCITDPPFVKTFNGSPTLFNSVKEYKEMLKGVNTA